MARFSNEVCSLICNMCETLSILGCFSNHFRLGAGLKPVGGGRLSFYRMF